MLALHFNLSLYITTSRKLNVEVDEWIPLFLMQSVKTYIYPRILKRIANVILNIYIEHL